MSDLLLPLLLILAAYLMGSFSSAIVLSRLLGLPDPRTQGSGNPGATNVLRYGGKKVAAATLLLDMLKGAVPVLLAKFLGMAETVIALAALAAFLGHLFPLFFQFRGGKGVATALGALASVSWPTGLAMIATWLLMAFAFRYSSLAALTAALLAPGYIYWFSGSTIYLALTAAITVLLFWRHRSNLQKLWQGTESKIGKKAA